MPKKTPAKTPPKARLKAERIQKPAPQAEPLKAERIQELLQQLPEWRFREDHRTLAREYQFPGRATALAYFQVLAALAADVGGTLRVEWSGDTVVTILLPLRPGDRLTEADLQLARQVERLR